MKKIILLLAVMLMTAPAMAAVTITVTDDGGGWAKIEYSHNEGANFIRAFALDIDANDANFVAYDSADSNYWVYPGTIDINDSGGVNDVGSPIAPNSYPGTLPGLDTNGVTIEMGALFEAGVDPDPCNAGTLLRLQVDTTCEVCVNGNAIRGNAVMKNAASNNPTEACATITVVSDPCPCAIYGDIAGKPWVNGGAPDGLVDSYDVVKIGSVWGQTSSGGPWDACNDVGGKPWVNGGAPDGVIDSYDVVKIGSYWGVPCP
ncbi:MAG: hypothetical protein ACYS18_03390 [Planctomycetota bacterium]